MRPQILDSVLDLVGGTDAVRIRRLGEVGARADVFAKTEHMNPAGSVKDRIALAILEEAERTGALDADTTIVEPTSGNTGVALAMVAARKGYRVILTMPKSMSLERRKLLEAFGAEVVLTDPEAQMIGARDKALEIARSLPRAFVPSQFDNPENPATHTRNTAVEILEAFDRVDAFVAAVGTGGTITGVGRALRERFPGVRVVAVEPEGSATISRGERGPSKIQGIAAGFVPDNYDARVVDEVRTVTDARAYEVKRALAAQEGLLVGPSSGANVAVALDVAAELGPGKTVLTILCDTGERYFSMDEYFR